jgi:hypothetical protein
MDLWCRLLHRHPRRDVTAFSLSACQREDKCISNYDYSSRSSIASEEYSPSTTLASGSGASVAGGSGTAWDAGVDSSAGGATSSATADEGSSPSQDKSVDFLQKHTQLVISQHRLLQQVLLAKMQYLQVRSDYCHGRGAKDAGDIDQSTFGGRLLLRPCGYRLLHSSGGRRSTLLRS